MNKFLKSFLVVIMVAAISLTSGCGKEGKEESSDGKITLEFWNLFNKGGGEEKFFTEKIKEYEKLNPNIKINQSNIPGNDYMGTKLSTAFATGTGPDIFVASPGTINNFIDSGITYPLNDYFTDEMLEDYSKQSIEAVTLNDGSIISIPVEQDLLALFYDKDALDEAGIAPPTTWDEMIDVAKKLTTDTRSGITFDMTKTAFENFQLMPFVWQSGEDFFKDGKANLNSQGVIKALELWRSFVDNKSANLKPSRGAGDIGILGDGETAMWIGGSVGIKAAADDYADRNIGVVPLPIPTNGTPVTAAGGWAYTVNAKGKNPDEAAKFLKWLFLDEDGERSVDWNTEAKFSYSPRKSVIEKASSIYQKGLAKELTDNVYETARPELSMPPEAADIIGDMIQDALFKSDPKVAAENAQKKMEEFLEDYDGEI